MKKRELLVVGSGFAALSFVKRVPLESWAVTVVSPRNHFLFTPLLPSTVVGTAEVQSVVEPIRRARRGVAFVHAAAEGVDAAGRVLTARAVDTGSVVSLRWDRLVLAPGSVNNTFGVAGAAEHALFLREAADAKAIRARIVRALEAASLPTTGETERARLLHFVIVGGGPSGVELAAELSDLLDEDLGRSYPGLPKPRITLVEAGPEMLTSFDASLREFTARHFKRQGIAVLFNAPAVEVGPDFVRLATGETLPAGLVVWSTGTAPSPFVRALPFEKDAHGRLLTDDRLRVAGEEDVFALGDAARPRGADLPQTAQVAMQQGKYLARAFREEARGRTPGPFRFRNLGMLAYVGEGRALADLPEAGVTAHGRAAYLFWRSAYLTRLVSAKNKLLVAFDWVLTFLFGRDLSTL